LFHGLYKFNGAAVYKQKHKVFIVDKSLKTMSLDFQALLKKDFRVSLYHGGCLYFSVFDYPIVEQYKYDFENKDLHKYEDLGNHSFLYLLDDAESILGSNKESEFILFDLEQDKKIWSTNEIALPQNLIYKKDQIILSSLNFVNKLCFDRKNGEVIWRHSAGIGLFEDFKNLGRSYHYENMLVGHDSINIQLNKLEQNDQLWYGFDLKSRELLWKLDIPHPKFLSIAAGVMRILYLENKVSIFYAEYSLSTGKEITKIDAIESFNSLAVDINFFFKETHRNWMGVFHRNSLFFAVETSIFKLDINSLVLISIGELDNNCMECMIIQDSIHFVDELYNIVILSESDLFYLDDIKAFFRKNNTLENV